MIKLHYSLVDVLDDCIQRLDHDAKKRRQIRPRTQITLPETKQRATIEIATSENFTEGPLTPTSSKRTNDQTTVLLDDDEFERNWIYNTN
jgi:hypothetical protein